MKKFYRIFKIFFRILLGVFLAFSGVNHLTIARAEFTAQVPHWLPISPDLTVVLSGIVEILLGIFLIIGFKRKELAGWLTALFFILIFPGNIAQYVNHVNAFGLNTDQARFIRLLFQPLLVLWALWSTEAWKQWRKKTKK